MQNPLIFNKETKTFPIIFHSPGMDNKDYKVTNSFWNVVSKISFQTKDYENIDVVLCNNYKQNCIVEKNLEKYVILGQEVTDWNNIYKIKLILDFLIKSNKDYILYLDSRDVVVLGDLCKIVEIFKYKNCDILFNAEVKFYPQCETLDYIEKFQRKTSKTKYFALNAGCWVARKQFLANYLIEILNFDIGDHIHKNKSLSKNRIVNSDQFRWHIMYEKYYPKIQLDYNCEVFQNLFLHNKKNFSFKIY